MLVLAWQRVNKVKEVAAILKAIHAQEDRKIAMRRPQAEQVTANLREMKWG
jgi:hypothetical protein